MDKIRVADVRIGLGYTAVMLANGDLGVAYTFRNEAQPGCTVFDGVRPLVGRSALELLVLLESSYPIEASVGLACANALLNRPNDGLQDGDILTLLDLQPDDEVAMVGQFRPLISPLQRRVRSLTVFERVDRPKGILRPAQEAPDALARCQVALITATSIINHTIDELLEAASECREVVILGASTPLLLEAFEPYRVTKLCGVVVTEPAKVLKVVSEGGGMSVFSKHVRKVSLRNPKAFVRGE